MSGNFKREVLDVVKKIPQGKVLTYQEVAGRAGRPKAYRAVGNILNKNFDPRIPCYRVIRSDGKIGGDNRGTDHFFYQMEICTRESAYFSFVDLHNSSILPC